MAVEFTACPEDGCGLPAEVVDRYEQQTTSGPVVVVLTACVRRHHLSHIEE